MKYTLQYFKKDDGMKNRARLVFMAVMVTALLIAAPLSTVSGDRVPGDRHGDENEQSAQLMRIYVTIAAKAKSHFLTDGGDRWQIAKNPLIIGANGRQVSLRDMPVPCEADILYFEKDNGRDVYRIEIKVVSQDAHQRFMGTRTE